MPARPVALVTGASSGIGLAFARRLAATGHDLVLVARNEERLQALAAELARDHGAGSEVLAADLTDPEDLERVAGRLGASPDVELLVNNAGLGFKGDFADSPLADHLTMVAVNVTALVRLSHAALAPMKARGRGGVVQLASIGSFQPGPHNAVYSATKAFVLSFSEALHVELQGTGVTVTAVCPGLTRTEFHERGAWEGGGGELPDFIWMDADDVVEATLRAYRRGAAVVVPGLLNKVVSTSTHLMPRRVLRRVSGMVASRV